MYVRPGWQSVIIWGVGLSTSNVTGRHQGPKHKLRAGYRAPSIQPTTYVLPMRRSLMLQTLHFSSSSVVSRAVSALCVYSKFRHHRHALGHLTANFCFFCRLHCWASPWRKSCTQSLNQLIWCPRNWSYRFGKESLHHKDLSRVKKQSTTRIHRPTACSPNMVEA